MQHMHARPYTLIRVISEQTFISILHLVIKVTVVYSTQRKWKNRKKENREKVIFVIKDSL